VLTALAPGLSEAIDVSRRKAFVILEGTLLRIDGVPMTPASLTRVVGA
jgi:hypothetical protein